MDLTNDLKLYNAIRQVANVMFASTSIDDMHLMAKQMQDKIIQMGGKLDDIRQYRDNMDKDELAYLLVLLGMKKDLCEANAL